MLLDESLASRYARVALANIVAEFPNKLDHLMDCAADVARPSALHPVFYGSYDWHSSVHMHWTLVTLRARFPQLLEADAIVERLDAHFTDENVAIECAYLVRPGTRSFERPYGWAWLLKLSAALHEAAARDARAARWRDCMQPLADAFVARFLDYLPRAEFSSRAGMHGNSAAMLVDHPVGCPTRFAILRKQHVRSRQIGANVMAAQFFIRGDQLGRGLQPPSRRSSV